MNCKPGDLAIVVALDEAEAPDSHYEGAKRNLKMLVADFRGCIFKCIRVVDDDAWEVEPRRVTYQAITNEGRSVTGVGTVKIVPDAILRPLRNSPGADETLFWADVPSSESAQVGETK